MRLKPSSVATMHHMSTTSAAGGWLQTITLDSSRVIADRTGLSASTITRAANADTPPAGVVVAVARAYEFDVLRALVLSNFLSPAEVASYGLDSAIKKAPSAMLLHELLEREHGK